MTLNRDFTLKKTYYAKGAVKAFCETKHKIRIGKMVGASGVPHTILIGFDPYERAGAAQGFIAGFTLGLYQLFEDRGFDWQRINQSHHKAKISIIRTASDGTVEHIATDSPIVGPIGNRGWTYQDYPMYEEGTYVISVRNVATGSCQGGNKQFYNATQTYTITQKDIDKRTEYDFGGTIPDADELGDKEQDITMILGAIAFITIPIALYLTYKDLK